MCKEQKDNVKKWLIFSFLLFGTVTLQRTILKGIWILLFHLQKLRETGHIFTRISFALNKNKMIELQTQPNGNKSYLYNSD